MKTWIKCAILICIVFSTFLYGGTTGKISGRIIDQESKEGLPGVNVVIVNSQMGAATDVNGRYAILNVPPGIYGLRISMMGYDPVVYQNVRVSIDLTTKVNVQLQSKVLEAGEEVTIVAERPMVQMDMTSSLSSVGAKEIKDLPVQEVGDVLELQAGIVRSGNNLHIRGGRSGEVAYWVDGVATTDVFSGNMGVTVENSAIEELQVVSGTFNAEYGQAMSGIINIITKEGGPEYTGQVKLYTGDYWSSRNEFSVLQDVIQERDPVTGDVINQKEVYGNPLEKFNPIYNGQFSLSGPAPFMGDKLTFFANGRYLRDDGHLYGREWFLPQGLPGDSSLVPMNPFEKVSLQGKLTFRITSGLKLNYNVFWSSSEQERTFAKNYKYNPNGRPGQYNTSQTHIFSLNHVLSSKTFYELKVNRFTNDINRYVYENPLAASDYLVRVPTDTANNIEAFIFDPTTPEGQQQLEELQQNRISYNYFVDPNGRHGYVHADSNQTPTSYSFLDSGMDMTQTDRSTSYWVGKFDITSQVNPANQVKAGIEYRRYELEYDWFTIRPRLEEDGNSQMVPFQPYVPSTSTVYHHSYLREPQSLSAYIQDKVELSDIILNIGLRFDWFDANGFIPADPTDPNIYDPLRAENTYKNPDAPEDERVEYTSEERKSFMYKAVDPKMQISPRLGIAYPITDRGVIHFSYGHFFQIPEFQYLYQNPGFKINPGSYGIFGNPDLNAQKTVMYEIGLQQQISENISIDAALFYRDVRDWVGTSPLISTTIDAVKYSMYENKDYSNVRGLTLKIEKRYSMNFSARLDYSYQVAEGTYSNPTDAFFAFTNDEEPKLALTPLNWDQNHTLNASIVYSKNQWTASLIGRFWTGRPYTPSFPRGEFVGSTALIGLPENSARRPNQKSVDVYLNRRFDVGAIDFNLFCNIYNVFDIRNETGVYTDTGTASYTTTIDPDLILYNPSRVGTVEEFITQPSWYSTPRQIQLGLTLEF